MATLQKVTRDNFTTLLKRSTQGRAGTPDGNIFFDTANDLIEIITNDELATVDLGSGLENNPLNSDDKIQQLAIYFFTLQEVEADPTLQQFRTSIDAVSNRMGKLVGAGAFLNAVTLATNATTTNLHDRDKIADSGFTEFLVDGSIQRIYHGVASLNPINATTQPTFQIAASLSEADRQAAVPINFANLGNINESILSFENGGLDNLANVLIIRARQFGYTIGETNSVASGVSELGAYKQGYGIGNSIVSDVAALSFTDVWSAPIAPYSNLSFFRFAAPQTRSGFASTGAGVTGDFTDEIQLSSGTIGITDLRAWLDALMLQDTDENANTGATGSFKPTRAEPLYTINPATSKLETRAGLYVSPAKLTAEAQQLIILTDDAGGSHSIPFNSGITITVSQAWLDDTKPWFRLMYKDAVGVNDFDSDNALTVLDASAVAISGDDTDGRISGFTLSLSYAYDTETAGGNVTAGIDQIVILQIGGIDSSKTKTIEFIISKSANISVDATTDIETN